jgi:hypothetical protein
MPEKCQDTHDWNGIELSNVIPVMVHACRVYAQQRKSRGSHDSDATYRRLAPLERLFDQMVILPDEQKVQSREPTYRYAI